MSLVLSPPSSPIVLMPVLIQTAGTVCGSSRTGFPSSQSPRRALAFVLGVGEAANAEEITQYSVWKEEPTYGRYGTRYAQRGREREAQKSISLLPTITNEQPHFTKGYKVTLYSDSLRATALCAIYINGPNLGYQRG